jgi:hypothetical protein
MISDAASMATFLIQYPDSEPLTAAPKQPRVIEINDEDNKVSLPPLDDSEDYLSDDDSAVNWQELLDENEDESFLFTEDENELECIDPGTFLGDGYPWPAPPPSFLECMAGEGK